MSVRPTDALIAAVEAGIVIAYNPNHKKQRQALAELARRAERGEELRGSLLELATREMPSTGDFSDYATFIRRLQSDALDAAVEP